MKPPSTEQREELPAERWPILGIVSYFIYLTREYYGEFISDQEKYQPGKISTGKNMAEFPKTLHIFPVMFFPATSESDSRKC